MMKIPKNLQLTRMIFSYWLNQMSCPTETIIWGLNSGEEGIFWYDGYSATFWPALLRKPVEKIGALDALPEELVSFARAALVQFGGANG